MATEPLQKTAHQAVPGCGRGLAEIPLHEQDGSFNPAAKQNGIPSSPAHRHSRSADSLIREVVCGSVGTAWAEVVWHVKISVKNCMLSHLPKPWWRERVGEKTKEEIPNKYSFGGCKIKRSLSSEQIALSVNSALQLLVLEGVGERHPICAAYKLWNQIAGTY